MEPITEKITTQNQIHCKTLRVLYIFAGIKRRSDLYDCLTELQKEFNFILFMREIDLLRNPEDDVTKETFWEQTMQSIRDSNWQVLIVTPPCHTHSRSRNNWRASPGPRPLRSKDFPFGFPWLTPKNKLVCEQANLFIAQTIEAALASLDVDAPFVIEHPEDLGVTAHNETPASIWQLPEIHDLQVQAKAFTWALFQCKFSAMTSKPTRFLSNLRCAAQEPYQGWPKVDDFGKYCGPLPPVCPHKGHDFKLVGRDPTSDKFLTAASASYPPDMCQWLARLIAQSLFDSPLRDGVLKATKPLTEEKRLLPLQAPTVHVSYPADHQQVPTVHVSHPADHQQASTSQVSHSATHQQAPIVQVSQSAVHQQAPTVHVPILQTVDVLKDSEMEPDPLLPPVPIASVFKIRHVHLRLKSVAQSCQ